MITVFTGDDSFTVSEELARRVAAFDGTAERIDGTSIERRQLPDLLMGSTLFGDKRLVVIRDLSKNSALWEVLPEWIDRLSDDIDLVLVDEKIDKRTSAYKTLKQKADVYEFTAWSDRDRRHAVDWVVSRAKTLGLTMARTAPAHLVERAGVDKWRLSQALTMLSLLEQPIDVAAIDQAIASTPSENVFELLEAALQGGKERVREMVRTLELQEDAYAVFALISSQVVQLLALSRARDGDSPEKDFAIHPFVASKLRHHVRRLGSQRIESIAKEVAATDALLKRSSTDPWVLVERTLLVMAS